MDDLAAVGQATLTSLARAGESALSFLLGGDQPARAPPRRRIGLDSTDGNDIFSRATPSPDEKTLRRGSSAGTGRWPPPHLYQPRPGSSSGAGGGGGNHASASPSSTASSQQRQWQQQQQQQRQQPWHLRARAVARAHAASLRDVAAMRFAYVDPDARWQPRGGGGTGRRGGGESSDDEGEHVAVVVVVAAHVRPRSVTRREALLHSVLVADEVLGEAGSSDGVAGGSEGDGEEEQEEEGGAGGGPPGPASESGGGCRDNQERNPSAQRRRRKKKKRSSSRDFVLVLFGASATVPALSFDAQFFAELHAALPPSHRDPERMKAFYVVHAGWGLRAWLAALRLSEPAVYGRAEFVASLRDLERRFGGDWGRIPRPPDHVLAADAKRVAAAAAAGQIL